MKKISLTIALLLLSSSAKAGVPFWLSPMPSTTTAYGTGYLSGLLKIYASTTTAAASPAITLNGTDGTVTATTFTGSGSGLTGIPNAALVTAVIPSSATGTYPLSISGTAATATNNVLKAGDTMTGDLTAPNVTATYGLVGSTLTIGTNWLSVTSLGVGINTTNPFSDFEVIGNADVEGDMMVLQTLDVDGDVKIGAEGTVSTITAVGAASFADSVTAGNGFYGDGSNLTGIATDLELDAVRVSTGALQADLSTEVSDRGIADAAIAVSTGITQGQVDNLNAYALSTGTAFGGDVSGNYDDITVVSVPAGAVDLSTVTSALAGKLTAPATFYIVQTTDYLQAPATFYVVKNTDYLVAPASFTYVASEADPVFAVSEAADITGTETDNWDTAYGWGDHAGLYLTAPSTFTYQSPGDYITSLTGDVTASGPGVAAATIVSVPASAVDLSTVAALAGAAFTGDISAPNITATYGLVGATVAIATDRFVVKDSSVGINTAFPEAALDVVGSGIFDGDLEVGGAAVIAGELEVGAEGTVSTITAAGVASFADSVTAGNGFYGDGSGLSGVIQSTATGNYLLRVATATYLATAPGDCAAGQYISGLAADGTKTCGTPSGAGDVVLAATQTFTGANTFSSSATFTGPVVGVSNSSSTLLAEYTTNQGSLAASVTGSTLTLITSGGRVRIVFSGAISNDSAAAQNWLGAKIDGVNISATPLSRHTTPAANAPNSVSFDYITDALSAGTHTFSMTVACGAGNVKVIGAGSTYPAISQFWVEELK